MFFVRKKVWLPAAIQRIFAFLLSFQLMTFTFFVIGNVQSFLDTTQFLLLRIQKVSGILFLFFGMYTVIAQFFSWYYEKKVLLLRFVLVLIGFAAGIIPIIVVYFFSMWTYPV
jgi:hypothetical protein